MLRVPRSSTCLNCGYDLQGIAPDGKCPECGVRASVSRSGDALETAPLPYLLKLYWGAGLLRWAWVAFIAIVVVGCVQGLVADSVFRAAAMAVSAMFVCAEWLVTTQQPQRWRAPRGNAARLVVRAATCCRLVASVLNAVDVQSLQVFETGLVVVLSTIIGHVAISLYFRAMAVRIRDSEMVRAATSLIWLPAVVVVAGFVLANILGTLVAVATVVGLFLVLVRGYFTVIEQFRRGLSRAMDVAARRELAGQAPAAVGVVGSDED